MPVGVPTAAQIFDGEVSFFSIDTDLIQSKGYNFDVGTLNQIPSQLPTAMKLQLTEVVKEEIVRHRMVSVTSAIEKITSASKDLKRLADIPMQDVDQLFIEKNPSKSAGDHFRNQVEQYAIRCRGGVLEIQGNDLAKELFDLYFSDSPPFGKKVDKKSEFPDATSLLLLEKYAEENQTYGLIASGDEGWAAYAEKSNRLYVVKTVEQLTELFASTDEHAAAIKVKILDAINDKNSALSILVKGTLEDHLSNSNWDASNVETNTGVRLESSVYNCDLLEYELEADVSNAWSVDDEENKWIVELTARIYGEAHVEVDFFAWDSIDREEVSVGSDSYEIPVEITVDFFLTCSNVLLEKGPEDWYVEIEIDRGNYSVPEFTADPGGSNWE